MVGLGCTSGWVGDLAVLDIWLGFTFVWVGNFVGLEWRFGWARLVIWLDWKLYSVGCLVGSKIGRVWRLVVGLVWNFSFN